MKSKLSTSEQAQIFVDLVKLNLKAVDPSLSNDHVSESKELDFTEEQIRASSRYLARLGLAEVHRISISSDVILPATQGCEDTFNYGDDYGVSMYSPYIASHFGVTMHPEREFKLKRIQSDADEQKTINQDKTPLERLQDHFAVDALEAELGIPDVSVYEAKALIAILNSALNTNQD